MFIKYNIMIESLYCGWSTLAQIFNKNYDNHRPTVWFQDNPKHVSYTKQHYYLCLYQKFIRPSMRQLYNDPEQNQRC